VHEIILQFDDGSRLSRLRRVHIFIECTVIAHTICSEILQSIAASIKDLSHEMKSAVAALTEMLQLSMTSTDSRIALLHTQCTLRCFPDIAIYLCYQRDAKHQLTVSTVLSRLRHAVCLSRLCCEPDVRVFVRLSVTLVDCDHVA